MIYCVKAETFGTLYFILLIYYYYYYFPIQYIVLKF